MCGVDMPESGGKLYMGDIIFIAGFRGFLNAMMSFITQGTTRHTDNLFLSSPLLLLTHFFFSLLSSQAPPHT